MIIVKIADRLHNMRTVWALNPKKAVYLAQETMEVWCPLCEYLGLGAIKSELEDICFAILHTDSFECMRRQLDILIQNPDKVSRRPACCCWDCLPGLLACEQVVLFCVCSLCYTLFLLCSTLFIACPSLLCSVSSCWQYRCTLPCTDSLQMHTGWLPFGRIPMLHTLRARCPGSDLVRRADRWRSDSQNNQEAQNQPAQP